MNTQYIYNTSTYNQIRPCGGGGGGNRKFPSNSPEKAHFAHQLHEGTSYKDVRRGKYTSINGGRLERTYHRGKLPNKDVRRKLLEVYGAQVR